MAGEIGYVSARALKAQLHDGGEIALHDARAEGVFHAHHLLPASCVPLSRLGSTTSCRGAARASCGATPSREFRD